MFTRIRLLSVLMLIAGVVAVAVVISRSDAPGGGAGTPAAERSAGGPTSDVAVEAQPNVGPDSGQPGQPQQAPATGNLDETFAAVAQTAPGFGGLFFDDAGAPTIYVQDPAQGDAAEAAVRATLGSDVGQAPINVVVGKYDYGQLNTWYAAIDSLFSNPAVVSTDIDEANNRLTVGVEDLAIEASVRAELDGLGIPEQAVNIEQEERAVAEASPIADPNPNLLSKMRPLAGGLRISDTVQQCTLGFLALSKKADPPVPGFVTASHCTKWMFDAQNKGLGPSDFHQPLAINKVGTEQLDPPLFACKGLVLATRGCRWSDSAFVKLDPGVKFDLGKIKRPQTLNIDNTDSDNVRAIDDTVPGDFVIVDTSDYPIMGQMLNKVGSRTGWTQGTVTRTCFKLNGNGTNPDRTKRYNQFSANRDFKLLCQFAANYDSKAGDSGSPVFQILDPLTINKTTGVVDSASANRQIRVRLKGLHIAKVSAVPGRPNKPEPDGTFTDAVFSPLAGVFLELGLTRQNVIVPNPLPAKGATITPPPNNPTAPKPYPVGAKPNPCIPQPATQVGGPIRFDVTATVPSINPAPNEKMFSDVCFEVTGTGGGIGKPVSLKVDLGPLCPNPPPKIRAGMNVIHVDWGRGCLKPGQTVTVTATTNLLVNPTAMAHWSVGGVIVTNTTAIVSLQPVLGGVADYPDLSSGSNVGLLAGVAAAMVLAATAGAGWYVRRRWLR